MSLISDLKNRVERFDKELSNGVILKSIIEENEAYIVGLNVDEQLYEQGVNNLGVEIMDYAPYSPLTIEIKRQKGQPTDRVTLYDTGEFHASFYLEIDNKQFEVKAHDEKTGLLMKKYGRQILGLATESLKQLIWDYIFPDLMNETKKQIYGKQ